MLPAVRQITHGPRFHWFGYYDKLQFDPSSRYVLGMESDFEGRQPEPGDRIRLGIVDLEDGDRCEALIRSGRKVVTIDLNPLSRTARKASITIVDNIIRAAPLLADRVTALASEPRSTLDNLLENYDNGQALRDAETVLRGGVHVTSDAKKQ